MARARNIKPSFFTNELLGTEDPMVSLTFLGLWCLADKVGILEDRPLRIKAELFPYRDSLDVNSYLSVLARLGFIVRYQNEGRKLIQVCNFRRHQSPHHTEKAKGYPFSNDPKSMITEGNGYTPVKPPNDDCECKVSERPDLLITDSGFTDSLIPDSLIPEIPPLPPKGEKPKRNAKIPDPFLLTAEMRTWAIENAPDLDIRDETENFVDYWRGSGKTKADWVATWRTWMRKTQKDNARRPSFGQPVNRQQQIENANAKVVQEIMRQSEQSDLGEVITIDGEIIHAY